MIRHFLLLDFVKTQMAQHTEEYIQFIRSFLVNRCVMQYISITYNKTTTSQPQLLESILDINIWNRIFDEIHPLFQYYKNIVNERQDLVMFDQNRLTTVYEQLTFHEYVDSLLNLKTLGPTDYQEFIKNMNHVTFRENLFLKYKKSVLRNTLKNHLIYLVNMYLLKQEDKTRLFTPDEERDIDIMINAIPYYDYISANPDLSENQEAHQYIKTYL